MLVNEQQKYAKEEEHAVKTSTHVTKSTSNKSQRWVAGRIEVEIVSGYVCRPLIVSCRAPAGERHCPNCVDAQGQPNEHGEHKHNIVTTTHGRGIQVTRRALDDTVVKEPRSDKVNKS